MILLSYNVLYMVLIIRRLILFSLRYLTAFVNLFIFSILCGLR